MLIKWISLAVLFGPGPRWAGAASAETPRIFCGRILADARVLYCYGAEPTPTKRDAQFPAIGEIDNLETGADKRGLFPYDSDDTAWPWLSARQDAAQQGLAVLRNKRNPGLVDECCLKACYISELMNYC